MLPLIVRRCPPACCPLWFPLLNLGSPFCVSAVALRFAFPASAGRKALDFCSVADLLRALLWANSWLIFIPLLVLGELLVSDTCCLLPSWMMALSLITGVPDDVRIAAIGRRLGPLIRASIMKTPRNSDQFRRRGGDDYKHRFMTLPWRSKPGELPSSPCALPPVELSATLASSPIINHSSR